MTRRVAHLHFLTHPQGLTACFCNSPHEPPTPDACQPIDCESWLDVRAGMELIWPDGKVSTVYAVALWAAYPAVAGKPLIVSGRDWERTGLDVTRMPTVVDGASMARGEPDFDAILERMDEDRKA